MKLRTKTLLIFGVLLSAVSVFAQSNGGVHQGITAIASNGNVMKAIPLSPIVVCGYPAVSAPGGACNNLVTTYTSPTEAQSCPSNAQVITPGTTTCSSTSDAAGNFAFVVNSPQSVTYYFQYLNHWYGPFVVTVGAATAGGIGTITGVTAGTGLTGGGIAGNVNLNVTNPVPAGVANGSSLVSNGASAAPVYQTKATKDVRDYGVDCTGATDSSTALNTLFTAINQTEVDFPNFCQIRADHQVLIFGQTAFVLKGLGDRPGAGGFGGPSIFGCNGTSGPLLYINRSGYGRIEGLGIYPKGPAGTCASSSFTESVQVDNNGAGGVTGQKIIFDHDTLMSNAQGARISGYIGLQITGTTNSNSIVIRNSEINCQSSSASYGIDVEGLTSDDDKAEYNDIAGCFQGIRHAHGNMRIFQNIFTSDGNFSVFGSGGGSIWIGGCASGPINILYNEQTSGGQFINSNNDANGGCTNGLNVIGNDMGMDDFDNVNTYPVNIGTTNAPYIVEGNQAVMLIAPFGTIVGSKSQAAGAAGPLGTIRLWGNTIQGTNGTVFGWCCQTPGFQSGQFIVDSTISDTLQRLTTYEGANRQGGFSSPYILRSNAANNTDDWLISNVSPGSGSSTLAISHGVGTASGGKFLAFDGSMGGITLATLATPGSVTVTPTGGTGTTNYSYVIVATTASGGSPSATASTSTGVTTLSGTQYNNLVWNPVPGASGYDIYRTVGGATQGKIQHIPAALTITTLQATATQYPAIDANCCNGSPKYGFKDTGLTGDASSPPVANTTGQLIAPSATITQLNSTTVNSGTINNSGAVTAGSVNSGPVTITGASTVTLTPQTNCLANVGTTIQFSSWTDFNGQNWPMFQDGTTKDCYTIPIVKTQALGYSSGQFNSWNAANQDFEPTPTTVTGSGISTNGITNSGTTTLSGSTSVGSLTATGEITTAASTTGNAGLNVPHGVAPTTPVNGDVWTTTAGLFVRINGSTVGPFLATVGALTQGQALTATSGGGITSSSTLLFADQFSGSDWCAKVNAAYLALPSSGGVIDARGFSSPQACNSNPYHGANKSVIVLLPSGIIVSSVPWYTPSTPNAIFGTVSGNGNSNQGSIIDFCGPQSGTWGGANCTANAVTVPQFPNATNQLTFHNAPHGPFPPGTYACGICSGGQGSSEQQGWNNDGFAHIVEHVKLLMGGNTNVFAFYSANDEERSFVNDVNVSNVGNGSSNANSAGFFYDRTEAANGQSGPTHFRMGNVAFGTGTQTVSSTSTWGAVFEMGNAPCVVSGGGGLGATCYVVKISGGNPTIAVGYPGSGYTSNPTYTVYGAPATYGGTQASDCTGTLTEAAGLVTSVTAQCVASDYSNGPIQTGPEGLTATMSGSTTGGFTAAGGVYIGGDNNPVIDYIHCEHMGTSCVTLGSGYDATSAGLIKAIDGTSTVTGDLIHIAPGNDGQSNFWSVQFTSVTGTPNIINDECPISGTTGKAITVTTAQGNQFGAIRNVEYYSSCGSFTNYGVWGSPYKATSALTIGQVVKLDTANANSVVVTATTDTGAGIPLGVAMNSVAAGAYVNVGVLGYTSMPLLGTGTCAIGNFVIVDTTTAGRVKCTSTFTAGTVIGKATAAQSSVGSGVSMQIQLE